MACINGQFPYIDISGKNIAGMLAIELGIAELIGNFLYLGIQLFDFFSGVRSDGPLTIAHAEYRQVLRSLGVETFRNDLGRQIADYQLRGAGRQLNTNRPGD